MSAQPLSDAQLGDLAKERRRRESALGKGGKGGGKGGKGGARARRLTLVDEIRRRGTVAISTVVRRGSVPPPQQQQQQQQLLQQTQTQTPPPQQTPPQQQQQAEADSAGPAAVVAPEGFVRVTSRLVAWQHRQRMGSTGTGR